MADFFHDQVNFKVKLDTPPTLKGQCKTFYRSLLRNCSFYLWCQVPQCTCTGGSSKPASAPPATMAIISGMVAALAVALASVSAVWWLVLLVTALSFATFYYRMTMDYGVFEKKGVPSIKPVFFFGNQKDVVTMKKSIIDFHLDFYRKFEGHKYAIYYEGPDACLYIRDADLMKRICVSDFDHFTDFGMTASYLGDLDGNDLGLVGKCGEEWRSLKASITPAFSPKNLRNIAVQVQQAAGSVISFLDGRKEEGEPIMMEDILGKFTMDCISRIVFRESIQESHH